MNMKLFASEQKVMEVLWRKGDLHAGRIAEILNDEIGWNRNTTYTVIKKCIEKGAIERQEPKQKNKHQGLSEQPHFSHTFQMFCHHSREYSMSFCIHMLLILFAALYIVCRPEEVCSVLFCNLLINISQLFGDFYGFRREFLIKSFFPDPFSKKDW